MAKHDPSSRTVLTTSSPKREQQRLLDLLGKLEWDAAFDHKAERDRRSRKGAEPAAGHRAPPVATPPRR